MILDLIALDPSSRVWIYQADRDFTYDELDDTREMISHFLKGWTSHNRQLNTYANIFHRRYLALFVDESNSSSASGCSIDASVHFVKSLESKMGLDFFNRNLYSHFDHEENIHVDTLDVFKEKYASGVVDDRTLVFDHLVKTKKDFLERWIVPLEDSWIKRLI